MQSHISRMRASCAKPCNRYPTLSPRLARPGLPLGGTRASSNGLGDAPPPLPPPSSKVQGASVDLSVILSRMSSLALPYWTAPEVGSSARWKLAGVVALTLATTGVSVAFNFIGRDFFNALSEKDTVAFGEQLVKYLGAFVIGIPVFVFKSYYQSKLALEWRQWMTEELMKQYFMDRTFYQLSAGGGGGKSQLVLAGASISGSDSDDGTAPVAPMAPVVVDNPDQRISSDIAVFTETAVGLALTLLNAAVDLITFSGILYSIYPPLFLALIVYSVGGTAASLYIGRSLVGLNFNQEAREADFRYNLVRVRENAESIAFFRGEDDERGLLQNRLKAAVENYMGLLTASRNLDFFTSFYRYIIQLLPAAVVAPLFFKGEIEFGVINQSTSAFNHVLNDLSLVVYQFESLAGFSAVVDRLGQFTEVMDQQRTMYPSTSGQGQALLAAGQSTAGETAASSSKEAADLEAVYPADWHEVHGMIDLQYDGSGAGGNGSGQPLLTIDKLSVYTPNRSALLVEGLSVQVFPAESLLIMGPSGAGKTSVLRAIAGLWRSGEGSITLHSEPTEVMFLPQKPYMVLGTLRDQVLYPCFRSYKGDGVTTGVTSDDGAVPSEAPARAAPSDAEVLAMLRTVRLESVLLRYDTQGTGGLSALDKVIDWAASLSLGEQQRLAWARLLLARPKLALMDEATSALDTNLEMQLYDELERSGITYVSVGHRPTLKEFHRKMLEVLPKDKDGGTVAASWEVKPLAKASAV